MKKRNLTLALIGPALFALCYFLLPASIFETASARAAVGTVAWMAFWWITAPVDFAVTAFLPIALNALLQMADMSAVIANYASETILLLLGASIISEVRYVVQSHTGTEVRSVNVYIDSMMID